MAGHLVGLRLALLRNGLRRSNWQQRTALALGALAGLPLAGGGFLLLALVPRAEPRAGRSLEDAFVELVGASHAGAEELGWLGTWSA